jgi:hypothetical protein
MAQHYGAYTWLLFYGEGGNKYTLRATGVTDPKKGTQYIDKANNVIWLVTRSSPPEGGGHKYPGGTPFTSYQDTQYTVVGQVSNAFWTQQKPTPVM